VLAGLLVIFGAVYMLNMIRKVFYGETNAITASGHDIALNEKVALGLIVIVIFWLGVYPGCLLKETTAITNSITENFAWVLQEMKKH
jgi:NADH-quinone oxidoreductase subunit M